MRQFLFLTFLFLSIGVFYGANIKDASARKAYVDNKEICRQDKGLWRIFNNDCADKCDNKFEYSACARTRIFACDCGVNKCWNGDKCVSEKAAQALWFKETEPLREARKAELIDLKARRIAMGLSPEPPIFDPLIHNIATDPSEKNDKKKAPKRVVPSNYITSISKAIPQIELDDKSQLTIVPTAPDSKNPVMQNPVANNPKFDLRALEKQACQNQNGIWHQFPNGCADGCSSKIAVKSICTEVLTFGCKCGESRCWDNSKQACTQTALYKANFELKTQKASAKINATINNSEKISNPSTGRNKSPSLPPLPNF
ncbi:MAG: hypothetical protein ACJAZX_001507 [Rickettsiales bacterium]